MDMRKLNRSTTKVVYNLKEDIAEWESKYGEGIKYFFNGIPVAMTLEQTAEVEKVMEPKK